MNETIKSIIEDAARKHATKSTAPDKETPDWIMQDFIAGADFIIQNKSLFSPAGEWVKASERPPIENKLLVFRCNGMCFTGWYHAEKNEFEDVLLGIFPKESVEWLDENHSPTSPDIQKLVEALNKISQMTLEPGETDYKYAFNRCWHIAINALNPSK